MIFKLKTWYRHWGRGGSATAILTLRLETDNIGFRDKIRKAIEKALVDPEPEPEQKPSVLGFHMHSPEDEE